MGCRFLFTISPLEETRLLKDGRLYGVFGVDAVRLCCSEGIAKGERVTLHVYGNQNSYQAEIAEIGDHFLCFQPASSNETNAASPELCKDGSVVAAGEMIGIR
jgi:hypothetical protein